MKTIKDYDLENKKVIIRVDFNVPFKDGKILDDNRLLKSVDTIKYAMDNKAKVILLSHLGRIKKEEDKNKNSLRIVLDRLSELLKINVYFSPVTRGIELEEKIKSLQAGEVLLIENTRFEDLNEKAESSNNSELAKYWASLGDIFINDAFGTAHRVHASNVGISSVLPSGIGFLMERELTVLNEIKKNPERPYTVIMGGAKVADKIGVINSLVEVADYILIGGGMSYSFLDALGYNVGKSLLDDTSYDYCKSLLNKYKDKIVLPIDIVTCLEINDRAEKKLCMVNEIQDNDIGVDIGPKTVEEFKKYIDKSSTVIWNGTVGCHEIAQFAVGTKSLLEYLSNSNCDTIICGGDTASAAINFGYEDSFKHISTGGGASLELLEGKILPGIECIDGK